MCRLAYLHFEPSVSAERRTEAVRSVATLSWNLGNKDGAGIATWTPGEKGVVVAKALKLEKLELPSLGSEVLIHARASTNTINLANTHPYQMAGAFLVHNGIVHLDGDETLKAKAKTDNDTELILKAYLAEKRDLAKALARLSGMANVAIWDDTTQNLILYADTQSFQLWAQDGITIICQESAQSMGVINSGLLSPYSFDRLPAGQVVTVPLSKKTLSFGGWVKAYEAALTSAVKLEVTPSYASQWETYYPLLGSKRSKGREEKPTSIIQTANGWTINGRCYSSTGVPLDGMGNELTGKKARKAKKVWAKCRRLSKQAKVDALFNEYEQDRIADKLLSGKDYRDWEGEDFDDNGYDFGDLGNGGASA